MQGRHLASYCRLGTEEEHLLHQMFDRQQLSARAYHRLLKVARTIADLDGEKEIRTPHLLEAVRYRSLEAKYWG